MCVARGFLSCIYVNDVCHFITHSTGNGTDYVSGPYFARFRRNSRRSTIIVNIVDDNRPELDETFRLTINATSLPFGVIRSNPYSTIVTIIDDECK